MRVLLIVPGDRNAAESVWGAADQLIPTEVVVLFASDTYWMGSSEQLEYSCYVAIPSSPSHLAHYIDQILDQEGAMDVIIWPPTELGIMASARWAARSTDRVIIPNVVGKTESGSLAVELYSGQVRANLDTTGHLIGVIPRKGAFRVADMALKSDETICVEITADVSVDDPSQLFTLVSEERLGAQRLQSARIIVSGGRGVGGTKGFEPLYQLAARFGGEVGASRAAVDAGWIEPQRQVGQTGVMVTPNVYIAVGISGAMQHLAGMAQSRHIVAINPDLTAPIFKYADAGVAANYSEVIEGMLEEIDSWEA